MTERVQAPGEEPQGYASVPSFVKSNPLNNQHYLDQMKDDEWYPILVRTDAALEELIPGYNINQIKSKFGGLRYYFDYPDTITPDPKKPWIDTVEKIRARADSVVSRAEAWVEGYEYFRKQGSYTIDTSVEKPTSTFSFTRPATEWEIDMEGFRSK